jgi:hypothetical protein
MGTDLSKEIDKLAKKVCCSVSFVHSILFFDPNIQENVTDLTMIDKGTSCDLALVLTQ